MVSTHDDFAVRHDLGRRWRRVVVGRLCNFIRGDRFEAVFGDAAEPAFEMAGCLLLLLAISLYARHVLLDAEGLLPACKAKPKPKTLKIAKTNEAEKKAAEKPKSPPAAGTTWRKIDPPQPTLQPPHQPASSPAARVVPVHPAFATASPSVPVVSTASAGHKLSKAERKALKERLLRERREREGR